MQYELFEFELSPFSSPLWAQSRVELTPGRPEVPEMINPFRIHHISLFSVSFNFTWTFVGFPSQGLACQRIHAKRGNPLQSLIAMAPRVACKTWRSFKDHDRLREHGVRIEKNTAKQNTKDEQNDARAVGELHSRQCKAVVGRKGLKHMSMICVREVSPMI